MKHISGKDLLLLDMKIKSGQIGLVQSFLESTDPLKVPRDQLAPLANIARRVGFHRFALSLLCPILRSQEPLLVPPTDSEKVEYAAALMRAGSLNESKSLLSELDPEKNPDVLFHRALLKIQTWNYQEAIPLLTKYIEVMPSQSYQFLIRQHARRVDIRLSVWQFGRMLLFCGCRRTMYENSG